MNRVKACVLTGYGLNCDYETDYSLKLAGADSRRVHINELIEGTTTGKGTSLDEYHILAFGGGFSWGDDHGAGVLLASKMKHHIGNRIEKFIKDGKLVIGICNGFQSLVNLGLLPGFDMRYRERRVALINNDAGNFIDTWVSLQVNPDSPCVFTRGLTRIELPVRHGEGKFYAASRDIHRLMKGGQIAVQYATEEGCMAGGKWPANPNGSLEDIAGICDPTGRVFGLMPHPEAHHHFTNHPHWTRSKESLSRNGMDPGRQEGQGLRIFRNAVEYVKEAIEKGHIDAEKGKRKGGRRKT
ncbi:MAG: phosphoribosylformylglycinamidine synthase [Deltaproteobacteria bacterium HGW-Deltaproteobacteria-21]|nr:MAG: phosphoribosylformylglycinamidine synthase [Deltaproteobacteria bacterium HGW-Deltaproteobacteria-21]